MGDLIKIETYDGSLESAKAVLINMNVKDDFYHFNVSTGQLVLIKYQLVLRPGDCYQYRLPESFGAIK